MYPNNKLIIYFLLFFILTTIIITITNKNFFFVDAQNSSNAPAKPPSSPQSQTNTIVVSNINRPGAPFSATIVANSSHPNIIVASISASLCELDITLVKLSQLTINNMNCGALKIKGLLDAEVNIKIHNIKIDQVDRKFKGFETPLIWSMSSDSGGFVSRLPVASKVKFEMKNISVLVNCSRNVENDRNCVPDVIGSTDGIDPRTVHYLGFIVIHPAFKSTTEREYFSDFIVEDIRVTNMLAPRYSHLPTNYNRLSLLSFNLKVCILCIFITPVPSSSNNPQQLFPYNDMNERLTFPVEDKVVISNVTISMNVIDASSTETDAIYAIFTPKFSMGTTTTFIVPGNYVTRLQHIKSDFGGVLTGTKFLTLVKNNGVKFLVSDIDLTSKTNREGLFSTYYSSSMSVLSVSNVKARGFNFQSNVMDTVSLSNLEVVVNCSHYADPQDVNSQTTDCFPKTSAEDSLMLTPQEKGSSHDTSALRSYYAININVTSYYPKTAFNSFILNDIKVINVATQNSFLRSASISPRFIPFIAKKFHAVMVLPQLFAKDISVTNIFVDVSRLSDISGNLFQVFGIRLEQFCPDAISVTDSTGGTTKQFDLVANANIKFDNGDTFNNGIFIRGLQSLYYAQVQQQQGGLSGVVTLASSGAPLLRLQLSNNTLDVFSNCTCDTSAGLYVGNLNHSGIELSLKNNSVTRDSYLFSNNNNNNNNIYPPSGQENTINQRLNAMYFKDLNISSISIFGPRKRKENENIQPHHLTPSSSSSKNNNNNNNDGGGVYKNIDLFGNLHFNGELDIYSKFEISGNLIIAPLTAKAPCIRFPNSAYLRMKIGTFLVQRIVCFAGNIPERKYTTTTSTKVPPPPVCFLRVETNTFNLPSPGILSIFGNMLIAGKDYNIENSSFQFFNLLAPFNSRKYKGNNLPPTSVINFGIFENNTIDTASYSGRRDYFLNNNNNNEDPIQVASIFLFHVTKLITGKPLSPNKVSSQPPDFYTSFYRLTFYQNTVKSFITSNIITSTKCSIIRCRVAVNDSLTIIENTVNLTRRIINDENNNRVELLKQLQTYNVSFLVFEPLLPRADVVKIPSILVKYNSFIVSGSKIVSSFAKFQREDNQFSETTPSTPLSEYGLHITSSFVCSNNFIQVSFSLMIYELYQVFLVPLSDLAPSFKMDRVLIEPSENPASSIIALDSFASSPLLTSSFNRNNPNSNRISYISATKSSLTATIPSPKKGGQKEKKTAAKLDVNNTKFIYSPREKQQNSEVLITDIGAVALVTADDSTSLSKLRFYGNIVEIECSHKVAHMTGFLLSEKMKYVALYAFLSEQSVNELFTFTTLGANTLTVSTCSFTQAPAVLVALSAKTASGSVAYCPRLALSNNKVNLYLTDARELKKALHLKPVSTTTTMLRPITYYTLGKYLMYNSDNKSKDTVSAFSYSTTRPDVICLQFHPNCNYLTGGLVSYSSSKTSPTSTTITKTISEKSTITLSQIVANLTSYFENANLGDFCLGATPSRAVSQSINSNSQSVSISENSITKNKKFLSNTSELSVSSSHSKTVNYTHPPTITYSESDATPTKKTSSTTKSNNETVSISYSKNSKSQSFSEKTETESAGNGTTFTTSQEISKTITLSEDSLTKTNSKTKSPTKSVTYQIPVIWTVGLLKAQQEVMINTATISSVLATIGAAPTAVLTAERALSVFAVAGCPLTDAEGVEWAYSEMSFPRSFLPGVFWGNPAGAHARTAVVGFISISVVVVMIVIVSSCITHRQALKTVYFSSSSTNKNIDNTIIDQEEENENENNKNKGCLAATSFIVSTAPIPFIFGIFTSLIIGYFSRASGLLLTVSGEGWLIDGILFTFIPWCILFIMFYFFVMSLRQTLSFADDDDENEENEEEQNKQNNKKEKESSSKQQQQQQQLVTIGLSKCDVYCDPKTSGAFKKQLTKYLKTDSGRYWISGHYCWSAIEDSSGGVLMQRCRSVLTKQLGPAMPGLAAAAENNNNNKNNSSNNETNEKSENNNNNILKLDEVSPIRLAIAPFAFPIMCLLAAISGFANGAAMGNQKNCEGALKVLVAVNILAAIFTISVRPYIVPGRNLVAIVVDVLIAIASVIALSIAETRTETGTIKAVQYITSLAVTVGALLELSVSFSRLFTIHILGIKFLPQKEAKLLNLRDEIQKELDEEEGDNNNNVGGDYEDDGEEFVIVDGSGETVRFRVPKSRQEQKEQNKSEQQQQLQQQQLQDEELQQPLLLSQNSQNNNNSNQQNLSAAATTTTNLTDIQDSLYYSPTSGSGNNNNNSNENSETRKRRAMTLQEELDDISAPTTPPASGLVMDADLLLLGVVGNEKKSSSSQKQNNNRNSAYFLGEDLSSPPTPENESFILDDLGILPRNRTGVRRSVATSTSNFAHDNNNRNNLPFAIATATTTNNNYNNDDDDADPHDILIAQRMRELQAVSHKLAEFDSMIHQIEM